MHRVPIRSNESQKSTGAISHRMSSDTVCCKSVSYISHNKFTQNLWQTRALTRVNIPRYLLPREPKRPPFHSECGDNRNTSFFGSRGYIPQNDLTQNTCRNMTCLAGPRDGTRRTASGTAARVGRRCPF